MRTTCLVLVVLAALTGAAAAADTPISKGSMMLDGRIYFQSYSGELWRNYEDDSPSEVGLGSVGFTQFSMEVTPLFSYFVSDGVCFGVQAGYQSLSVGHDKLNSFAVGPSLGYYVKINPTATDNKGSFYAYGRVFFNFGTLSDEHGDGPSITQIGGKVGLLYMISSAVGTDFSVKVQGDSWKAEGASESESGMTIRVGLGLTAFVF
jgi:hypothetical protein